MADDQCSEMRAEAQKYESLFVVGVVRVIDEQGVIVCKRGFGFFERNAVLALVRFVLFCVPFDAKRHHYNVTTS